MLNFFLSLFSFNDATKKKTDTKIPNDVEINDIETSEKIDDYCNDEEYDIFLNEFNDYRPSKTTIKKSSSLNLLPKDSNPKISIEYNPINGCKDNCSNCQIKIYNNFNRTYHAYDRLWCYRCWSNLDFNSN